MQDGPPNAFGAKATLAQCEAIDSLLSIKGITSNSLQVTIKTALNVAVTAWRDLTEEQADRTIAWLRRQPDLQPTETDSQGDAYEGSEVSQ